MPAHANHQPLFDAVAADAVDTVTRLLADGDGNVNSTMRINKVLYTPLMLAAELGYVQVVRALLGRPDVQVNRPTHAANAKSPTPLILASMKGHVAVVHELLAHPDVDVNATMEKHATAVQLAAANGFADVVDALWPTANVFSQRRSLDAALAGHKFEVVAHMVENGVAYEPSFQGHLLLEFVAPFLTFQGLLLMLSKDLPVKVADSGIFGHHLVPNPDYAFSWAAFLDPSLVRVSDEIAKEAVASAIFDALCPPLCNNHGGTTKPSISREQVVRALLSSHDQHHRPVLAVADPSLVASLMGQLYFAKRYEIIEAPPVHVSATSVVVVAIDHGLVSQVFNEYACTDDGLLNVDGFVACNSILGQLAPPLGHATSSGVHQSDILDWTKAFDVWDSDGIGGLSSHVFRQYCDQTYGAHLRVALKLMKQADALQRELGCRRHLDSQFVLPLLPSVALEQHEPSPDHGAAADPTHMSFPQSLAEYPYVVAMPAGDRTLLDILVNERPSRNTIRGMLEAVAKSVAHLHEHGMVHGDLKPRNVLRVRDELKLIDFNAATWNGELFSGTTFSSGTLAPEMLVKLNTIELMRRHEAYCCHGKSRASDDSYRDVDAAWHKLKPRRGYVVRTALAGEDVVGETSPVAAPYSLRAVAPAMDVWAFGCMMYQVVTGAELVPTDLHDDVIDDYIHIAATWTDVSLRAKLSAALGPNDALAMDLLTQLLRVDPAHRVTMEAALQHPYFTGKGDTFAGRLDEAVDAAAARHAPSFDPRLSPAPVTPNTTCYASTQALGNRLNILSPSTSVSICGEVHTMSVPPTTVHAVAASNESCAHELPSSMGTGCVGLPTFVLLPDSHWDTPLDDVVLARLASFVVSFRSTCRAVRLALDQSDSIQAHLAALTRNDPLYLYLMDGVTGQVVPGHTLTTVVGCAPSQLHPMHGTTANGGYPLPVVPTDVEFLALSLPFAEQGLACFVRHYLPDVATLPPTTTSLSHEPFLHALSCKRGTAKSVTFGAIHRALRLKGSHITPWHVRQAMAKQVERWINRRLPDLSMAGLSRTATEDGDVVWTIPAHDQDETADSTDACSLYGVLLQNLLRPRSEDWSDVDSCQSNRATSVSRAPQVPAAAGSGCSPDQCVVM
ncbi:serine/threonine protein kinase [Aphanomyces invadans]|uniref:Serine/threonine protein kinase n=1 Tax=Aphanomyces invadans TaxID=157072 RepID=A0A024TR23_9STRA|nr:serine/threonine protein kinase [Aphanomyces invadans]ETV96424.1 serine/threonine protein kinase [Aphanomyces invadans]|eukprot:XP_008874687.1 serine/threonine protein kinase [Aphanomyces invadans]